MKGRIDSMDDFPEVSFSLETSPGNIEKYLDKDLEISIKQYRKKRSLDANACLWACIGDIAAEIGSDNWSVYLYMLERYGVFTHIMVKPDAVDAVRRQWRETKVVGEIYHDGERLVQMLCYYGSSTYDSKEFSRLLDGVISDMKELELDTPLDEDIRAMIADMERNEQDDRS